MPFSFGSTSTSSKPTGFSFGNASTTSTNSFGSLTKANTAANVANTAPNNFSFANLPDKKPEESKEVKINEGQNQVKLFDKQVGLGGTLTETPTKSSSLQGILKKSDGELNPDGTPKKSDSAGDKTEGKEGEKGDATANISSEKKSVLNEKVPKEIFEHVSNLEKHMKESLDKYSNNIQKTSTRSNFDRVYWKRLVFWLDDG